MAGSPRRKKPRARPAAGKRRPPAKRPRKKRKAGGRHTDPRGTVAVLLAVVAFLVAAATFPLHLLGSVSEVFPAGNPVGETGERLRVLLVAWLGLGSATVPFGLLAAAASTGGWWGAPARRRLWIVTVALFLILPVAGLLAGGEAAVSGRLGSALGEPLRRTLGWLGAWVVVVAAAAGTSIAAFRFNPLQPPAVLAGTVGRAAARGARKVGTGVRGWWAARPRKRPGDRRKKGAGKAPAAPKPKPGEGSHGLPPPDAEAEAGADAAGHAPDPLIPASREGAAASPRSPAAAGDAGTSPPAQVSPPTGPSLPPLDLLTAPRLSNRFGMERDLDRLAGVLVNTLRTFNIECEIGGRTTGPAVTQYEVVPAAGVKVNRIASLEADLALAMRARSVRIVAPIPGKGAVGVEIPNPRPEMVRLREILETAAFAQSGGALPLAMGKDLTGMPCVADLAGMPHALIAGATGSGKSVCLNTIITSLVYRYGPESLRLLLIDPKMVELSAYADLPHLRHPVVTDPREAATVLKWACMEMERRYALLSANGVRSLQEFNERLAQGAELRSSAPPGAQHDPEAAAYEDGPLPWIVVVVDELADLMMTVQAEVEKPLAQLAQKARAIGIHLLVATQRPSVNVVTGLIKANFPCRIAFRVASKTDSRTILDQNGADALLGHGDMLFLPPGQSEPVRMQGAFISTEETGALMQWFRDEADTLEAIKARVRAREADILQEVQSLDGDGNSGDEPFAREWDELFRAAAEACMSQGSGSTSLLQRRLRIGYGRAARIVDQLHEAGRPGTSRRLPAPRGAGRRRGTGRDMPRVTPPRVSGRRRPVLRVAALLASAWVIPPPAAAAQESAPALEAAARRYQEVQAICADFEQVIEIPMLRWTRESAGRICQQRPNLFSMRFTDPDGDMVIADGEYVWVYYPSLDEEQVNRFPAADSPGREDFFREFLENPGARYDAEEGGIEEVGGRTCREVTLTPRDGASYRMARLWVDAESHVIRRVEIHEQSDRIRTLTLSDVDLSSTPDPAVFVFQVPEGARVMGPRGAGTSGGRK